MTELKLPWKPYDKNAELEYGYYLVAKVKKIDPEDPLKYCEVLSLPYYKKGARKRVEYLQMPNAVIENANYPEPIELLENGFYEKKGPYFALSSDITHYVKIDIPDTYDGDMQQYDIELNAYLLGNLLYPKKS